MKILVLNCGSSSVKYKLIDTSNDAVLAEGGVEKIGLPDGFLKYKKNDGSKAVVELGLVDHNGAVQAILNILTDPVEGCIKAYDEILDKVDKYLSLFDINKFREKLRSGREKFVELSLKDKKDTILKVLEGLHDNAVRPKVPEIGLSTPLGFMQFSNGVLLSENARLIYQSPTGLFKKSVKISDL